MVFFGSKQFPEENGMDKLVKSCGGRTNGVTDLEVVGLIFIVIYDYEFDFSR